MVPVLEGVSPDSKTPVVVKGEPPLDVVHHLGQRGWSPAAQEVHVVGQKGVGKHPQAEPLHGFPQQGQVDHVVLRSVKEPLLVVAAGGHVVHGPFYVHSRLTGHHAASAASSME